MKLLLIAFSALLLLPNFFNVHLEQTPQYDQKELFNPRLAYINSIDKLIETCDSLAGKNKIATNSFAYALMVSDLLRERFYHGFSRYPLTLGKNPDVTFGKENAVNAPNASLFHTTTKYLSKTLWLFPLLIVFKRRKKVSNRAKYFTPHN